MADLEHLKTVVEGAGSAPGAAFPEHIGRYAVQRLIGHGATSTVVLAHDTELHREVALKVVHGRPGQSDEIRRRALREARTLARLQHPNVPEIYEVGEHDDTVYLASEFVEGPTLYEWFADDRIHPWREVMQLFIQVARALSVMHEAGLVHRDVKLENLLVTREGRVVLVDFGLAVGGDPPPERPSLEQKNPRASDRRAGTPAYMSPEQFAGNHVDARSDQFSFCVALYEALYGARPFDGEDYETLQRTVSAGELRPPPTETQVPAWITKAVLRGLSVDASDRFADMAELVRELGKGSGVVPW